MVATMSKLLHVSRTKLHKYTKLRVKIDENNEVSCWDLICREAYKDRMEEGIREKVIEYWDNHSHAIPYRKHVLQQNSSRGIYKEGALQACYGDDKNFFVRGIQIIKSRCLDLIYHVQ